MYIFDTDHLSLYGRNHPAILAKLRATPTQLLTTTAINAEEQLRGRLAQIAEAKNESTLTAAYQWLVETITFLSAFQILPYDAHAQSIYRTCKAQRIASIVLAHNGILLTRNSRDFDKVPGLVIQDWSI